MDLFKKYESITRATKVETLLHFKANGYGKDEKWYATEKVHGSNIGFIIADINYIKNTDYYKSHLNNPEKYPFFIISEINNIAFIHTQRTMITKSLEGTHLLFHKVEEKLRVLQKHLNKPIHVYGECYGAKTIPTPDSIPYFKAPEQRDFIFFDIRFIDTNEFCSYPEVFELFDKFELSRVPLLKEGTLDECLKLPKSFKSIVSENDVLAEGFVLKPFKSSFIQSARVILKMIAPEFDDEKKSPGDLEIARQKQKNFENLEKLQSNIEDKINMVRLGKVAAKFGITNQNKNNFGHLKKHFLDDITEECTQQSIELSKAVRKVLDVEAVKFVKVFFESTE